MTKRQNNREKNVKASKPQQNQQNQQNNREKNVKASKPQQNQQNRSQKRSAQKRSAQKRSAQKRSAQKRSAQKQRQNKNQQRQNRTQKRQNRKKSNKRSTKKRRRQRGGYLGSSVLPGKINENGIWISEMDSKADFGIFGSDYQGSMLEGAEVDTRAKDSGKLSGDLGLKERKSEFIKSTTEDGQAVADAKAEAAVAARQATRNEYNTDNYDGDMAKLADLAATESVYHDAYERYDGLPTDAAGDRDISAEDLKILKAYGSDNVDRAGKIDKMYSDYKDVKDDNVEGTRIKNQANIYSKKYGPGGSEPPRNFPPK